MCPVNIDGSCDFGLVSFSGVTFVVLFKVKIICINGIGLIRDSLANFWLLVKFVFDALDIRHKVEIIVAFTSNGSKEFQRLSHTFVADDHFVKSAGQSAAFA